MGRVDCLEWPGRKCWFWSEDHREPHFHVQSSGEWEIRIFFGQEPPYYDVVWQVKALPGRALKKFLREAAAQREALFAEWDAKVKVQEQ